MIYTSSVGTKTWKKSLSSWTVLVFSFLLCLLLASCEGAATVDPNVHDNGQNNNQHNNQPSCSGIVISNSCNVNNSNNYGGGGNSNSGDNSQSSRGEQKPVQSTQQNCPTPDQVASSMNLPPGSVSYEDNANLCTFHWGDNGATTAQAQCPTGFGSSSVELTRVDRPPTAQVIECTGNNSASLPNMYGMVVRFENWNSNWNACEITKEHRARLHDDVQGPAGC